MLRKTIRLCAAVMLLSLLFAGGCSIFPEPAPAAPEYDLGEGAELEPVPVPVRIGVIRNLSGSDRRFLFRRAENRMVASESGRWLLSPDLLIERRLLADFSGSDDGASKPEAFVRIDGTLVRFEFDEAARTAELGMDYTLKLYLDGALRRTVTGNRRFSVSVEGEGAAAEAAAMSRAVDQFAAAIREQIVKQPR